MTKFCIILVVLLTLFVFTEGSDSGSSYLWNSRKKLAEAKPQIVPSPEPLTTTKPKVLEPESKGKVEQKPIVPEPETKGKVEQKETPTEVPEQNKSPHVKGKEKQNDVEKNESPNVEQKGTPDGKVKEGENGTKVPKANVGQKGLPDGKVAEPSGEHKGSDNVPLGKKETKGSPDGKVVVPDVDKKGSKDKVPEPNSGGNEDKVLKEGEGEKCKEDLIECNVKKSMIACLEQRPGSGSQDLFLLVQNEGDSTLKVDITAPESVKISSGQLEIPIHQAQKINVSVNVGGTQKITLNDGSRVCVLHIGAPTSDGNYFHWVPSYANLVTPIYGAYFVFFLAVVVGGTWGCCKFVRRRHGSGGIPYQELEMGLPQSSSAANLDTTDGWDEGWDSDWDEERAVRSPGHRTGNVSANGLTSRSPKKDGWEDDWDD